MQHPGVYGKNKVSKIHDNVRSVIIEKMDENFKNLSHKTGKKHTLLCMDMVFISGDKSRC